MFVFAVKSNPDYPITLTQKLYDETTKRSYPYIQKHNNENVSYAICPDCKCPVRLVNRNRDEKVSATLYAMHVPYTVPELAIYDQVRYNRCNFRNPARMDGKARRDSTEDSISLKIKDKIREHFDLLVAIIKIKTSVSFSNSVINQMLDDFVANKGHTYRAVTLYNIPYSFLYMTEAQDLYGCRVSKEIADAINKKSDSFTCYYGSVVGRKKGQSSGTLILFFSDHSLASKDSKETIQLNISEVQNKKKPEEGKNIFNKKIEVDNTIFDNYIKIKADLLQLAKSKL